MSAYQSPNPHEDRAATKYITFFQKRCPKIAFNDALLSRGRKENVEAKDSGSFYYKGGTNMNVGDVVRFRGRDYHVGPSRTDTSIELVELKQDTVGLWVSRAEIHELPPISKPSMNTVEFTSDSVGV
jgi:hypothetical protein